MPSPETDVNLFQDWACNSEIGVSLTRCFDFQYFSENGIDRLTGLKVL